MHEGKGSQLNAGSLHYILPDTIGNETQRRKSKGDFPVLAAFAFDEPRWQIIGVDIKMYPGVVRLRSHRKRSEREKTVRILLPFSLAPIFRMTLQGIS